MAYCCLRFVLTFLHASIGLGAGFFFVYSLAVWNSDTCLPGGTDTMGIQLPFKTDILEACKCIVYGMCVICILNIGTCVIINFKWHNTCIAFVNLVLAVIYIAFAVMGGTAVVVYYIVWCDFLERTVGGSHGCKDAAQIYDHWMNPTGQMSLYKTQIEIQMTSLWILFPLVALSIMMYSLTMHVFAKQELRDRRFRYIILHDETMPLLRNDSTPPTTYQNNSTSINNVSNATPESTTPLSN